MAILYCGWNFIGSQCSSRRSGVTWSYLDFLRTSFAALFWTLCKHEIYFKGNPARMELQSSSLDVMADETSWAVALWVKYGRIEAILLSSRYAARHTLLMCCCIDSVWSRWTPRFLTEDLNGMCLPPMFTLSLPTELRREVDATGRTSVFSAFSLSLLLYIQPTRLSMQVWISQRRDWNWSGGAPFDNWVSSAYLWLSHSWRHIQSERGWEHNVNRIGPRTEPCGTPNWRGLGEDKMLSTFTDCSRPSK